MARPLITDAEFRQFQGFIYDAAGITISPAKKALVAGRLAKRVHHCGLESYGDYFRLLSGGAHPGETQVAVDLLTTNETYFFREARHFDLLRQEARDAARAGSKGFQVWSAACSSGEEVYSIAMTLADAADAALPWTVLGSDISARVLERARRGHYPLERAKLIPTPFLHRYCLKGMGKQDGTLLVTRELRQRVQFAQVNLNAALPRLGPFDVVFLRNVMIYFSKDTKREVVKRIASVLKPGGLLVIGHSESLHDIAGGLQSVAPSLYRKPKEA
ncbi:MAG: CheR family methyltransferase [Janthinobacterium lividum]